MDPFTLISNDDLQATVYAYEPPKIEVIEVTVEKGFSDSASDWGSGSW